MNFLLFQNGSYFPAEIIIYLKKKGIVEQINCLDKLTSFIEEVSFKIVFLSPNDFSDIYFFKVLELLKSRNRFYVVISDRDNLEFIENCYKLGCSHYLSPPISLEYFESMIERTRLFHFLSKKFKTSDLDFWSQIQEIDNLALGIRPLLLTGPTGVGKTKLAELIHLYLFGNKKNFVSLNCSEISENLLESELFGYKKGAFTGANSDKKGLLSMADGGTLFLDEIATMPLSLQRKLLKAIDEKSFYPVGSEKRESSNFFLISATCENLFDLMEIRKFRKDLYYRIEGINIHIKGIQERREDIFLLIKYFLDNGSRKIIISEEAMDCLLSYDWPGNVREIFNVIEHLRMVKGGIIKEIHLRGKILSKNDPPFKKLKFLNDSVMIKFIKEKGLTQIIEDFEEEILNHFYNSNKRKVRKTMSELKISNNTFYRIKKRIS